MTLTLGSGASLALTLEGGMTEGQLRVWVPAVGSGSVVSWEGQQRCGSQKPVDLGGQGWLPG